MARPRHLGEAFGAASRAISPRKPTRLHARARAAACASLRMRREAAWLPLTIDAEEADRLDLSSTLFEAMLTEPALAGWNGLGLAVQAYRSARCP